MKQWKSTYFVLNRHIIILAVGLILAVVLLARSLTDISDFVFHLDVYMGEIITNYGAMAYVIIFGIIFGETGLVFIPFLPGDSLLFVAGAFTALGSLNISLLLVLLITAAIAGDTVNYWIGHFFGERLLSNRTITVNKKYLKKTQLFFARHGGKTIILARFIPIIRTYAPFVAGVGNMHYSRFLFYNLSGGILWITIGILAGHFFGNVSLVKNNFTLFVYGIVFISLIPVLITLLRETRKRQVRLSETNEMSSDSCSVSGCSISRKPDLVEEQPLYQKESPHMMNSGAVTTTRKHIYQDNINEIENESDDQSTTKASPINNRNAVIMPALNPDERLISLVKELHLLGQTYIAIIDDGSSARYQTIFNRLERMGCLVYHHVANMGKGEAIKTGIRMVSEKIPGIKGYITADSDGQHLAKDIIRVSEALEAYPEGIILGTRDFKRSNVPRKSRFGNRFSALYFRLSTGVNCPDTQTGLRGLPSEFADFALAVPGSRFEYEMNFLWTIAKMKTPIHTVPIETVYYEENKGTHFRAVVDSIRVYKTPLRFAAASLTCAAVDLGVFTLITHIVSTKIYALVFIATVTARILSGLLNFILNRNWSFNARQIWTSQAARYFTLFVFQMMVSWLLVWGFSFLPIPLTVIKVIIDSALFVFSYIVQRDWVFAKRFR